ncbi:hypothetical protein QJQ45_002997 [Haematococcus lacustris]|nr:hypothetical protein QJQ45_002997 [Haematococcus lacustris]
MVKSEADVSAPAEQPQMAVLMPQPLPLNEATSFVEWRHGAMGQLRLAGLWKAMVGEDTDPVRSERAYAWLLCNCKSHYLRLVVAAETAPAAWKALLADQQPDSYQLWEQLNSLQMQPGETVGQVHSRLLEIVWQLAAVKEQVSEPQQVMALLKAMPPLPQYENARDFITFGSLRSPLSLTEVKRTLQIAESRAQQAGVSAQLAAVRLRGKGGGGGGGGGGSSSSGSSSSRTQPAAVPAASSSSSAAPSRPRAAANVKCFKCGKRGHYARDCPDPARDGGMAGTGAGGEGGGASGGGAGGWAGAGKSSSGSAGLSRVTLAAVHASTLSHVAGTAPPLPACMPAEAGVGVGGAEVHSCSAEAGSVVSCGDMTCCWSHAVGLSPMLPCVVDKHASLAPEPAAEPALLAVASTQQLDSSMRVWVADSGASHHITPERSLLHGYQGFAQPVPMGLGKSSVQLYAYGKGRVRLAVDGVRMELQDVLWAPEASTNYFSTLAAAQKGWEIRQTADTITMVSSKGELVKGRVVGRQYQLSGSAQPAVVACEPPASAQAVTAVTPQLLHERLGHLSYRAMGDMISKGMVEGVELSAGQCRAAGSGVCPGCAAGKLHRRVADTLPSLAARVAAPCDLVHTDVCGPLRIPNAAGYCFVLTFLDEHSGLSLIALLKAKSEVPAAIRDAVEWFETQGGRKVKVLRSDRGTEYVNQAVREFLGGKGIIHQQTAPYSPQQNGSAERLNRTLFEKGRCLLYSSGLSVNFWPYALRFANYVRNLSLVRGKAGTPWELFWGVRPDLSALRVFGARAYAHVPEHMRSKLGSKAVQGVFVGYELSSKAYQVLLPGGKLLITKDVVFDELDRGLPTREADLAMLLPQPEPEPGVLVPHAVHVPVEVQLPAPPAAVPAPLERAPAPPGGATSSAEAGSSSSARAGSGSSAGAGSSSSAGAGSSSSAGAGSSSSAGAGSGAAGSGGGTEAVGRGSGAAGAAGGEGSGAANLLRQSSRLRGIQPEFAGVRSVAVAELPAIVYGSLWSAPGPTGVACTFKGGAGAAGAAEAAGFHSLTCTQLSSHYDAGHIDVLHHFVRERVARGELVFKFCGSAANVADVFTKALPSVKFEFCKAGTTEVAVPPFTYDQPHNMVSTLRFLDDYILISPWKVEQSAAGATLTSNPLADITLSVVTEIKVWVGMVALAACQAWMIDKEKGLQLTYQEVYRGPLVDLVPDTPSQLVAVTVYDTAAPEYITLPAYGGMWYIWASFGMAAIWLFGLGLLILIAPVLIWWNVRDNRGLPPITYRYMKRFRGW